MVASTARPDESGGSDEIWEEATGALANHDRQRATPPIAQPPPPLAEPEGEFDGKPSTEALKREFDARLEALHALGKRYKQPSCHAPDCWWQSLPEVQLEVSRLGAIPELVRLSRSRDADTQRHAACAIGRIATRAPRARIHSCACGMHVHNNRPS